MEWFSRKTPIAGTEIHNWAIILGVVVAILVIYYITVGGR
jgi:hypothetical protein